VGEKPGTATCKTEAQNYSIFTTVDTRELNSFDLVNIARETALLAELNDRDRDIVNVRGFKIEQIFRNKSGFPMTVNWAVIASKLTSQEVAPDPIEFFRGNDTNRGENFNVALNTLRLHKQPINTDRWAVLCHKRFRLNRNGGEVFYNQNGKDYRWVKRYIKINRQIRFNGVTPLSQVQGQLWLVFWIDRMIQIGGAPVIVDQAEYQARIVTYFREPK